MPEFISQLEPRDEDGERFARELADDLQGTAVDVAWLMVTDEVWLIKRGEHAED